jgi:hypothetical protein
MEGYCRGIKDFRLAQTRPPRNDWGGKIVMERMHLQRLQISVLRILLDINGYREDDLSISLRKAGKLTSGLPTVIQWRDRPRVFRAESVYPHSMTPNGVPSLENTNDWSGSPLKLPNVNPKMSVEE